MIMALRELAVTALEASAAYTAAIALEPPEKRHELDYSICIEWCGWYDDVLTPALQRWHGAVTALLAHPAYVEWARKVWRDEHFDASPLQYAADPVAAAIVRAAS